MDKYWKGISSPVGLIWIAVNEANFLTDLSFALPEGAKEGQMPLHAVAKQQLFEYFYGKRKDFSLPIQCSGTDFQQLVWDSLKKIPYGTTVSYQDIARCIGRPNACRAVGGAVHCNPIGIVIPCHRVIGKKGTLTGYAGGLDKKRELLQIESKERIYFPYGEKETNELVHACPEFSELVKKKGHIYRPLLPDVFTSKDLGLNRAVAKLMNKQHVTEQEMKDFGRYVSPLGTVASFYLWEMN